MRAGAAGLVGRAIADHRAAGDQHRAITVLSGAQRVGDGRRVVAVNRLAGPTRGGETGQLIVRGGERHRPIDGDAVVVEEDDQFRQLVMAGQ